MAIMAAFMVIGLLLLPFGQAQERQAEAHPHGLPFESPLALSPAAYEFFHPSERARGGYHGGVAPALSPRGPLSESAVRESGASTARADHGQGGMAPVKPARAGVLAGVFVGAAVVVLAALGLAYAVARRRVAHADAEAAGAPKSIA